MARKPREICRGAYHVMCRGNQGQSIFKELAKELGQDPAVLSSGLGKLAEALASKPKLYGVVEPLDKHMRQDDAQKVDKGEKRGRETGTFYLSLPNGPRCSRSGHVTNRAGFDRRHLLPRYQCYWGF
jgi:hypothetical protein